jgi:YHS domain-containing protein
MYMGKTYYFCCSGCRDEFNASPAKYVKEYEEKQAKAKKK